MTVPTWADVAAWIEWRSAQRARQPARRDDPVGAIDEPACGGQGHTHSEHVRTVLVVVIVLVGIDRFAILVHGARLDEDPICVAVPAQGQ